MPILPLSFLRTTKAPQTYRNSRPCNCRNKDNCPLRVVCLPKSLICKATLQSANQPSKFYYGRTETEFKTRFNNHKQRFKDSDERWATALSRAVWKIKDRREEPQITWNILACAPTYQSGSKLMPTLHYGKARDYHS